MTEFDRILVPTDFSEHSQQALDTAIGLARAYDAELHLLHCYSIHSAAYSLYGVAMPPSFEQEFRDAAAKKLAEWAEKARAADCRVSEHLSARYAAEEIPAVAGDLGADLIVMGTRGLGGIKHVLLGSVAERTIRAAPCPVLTVKRPDTA